HPSHRRRPGLPAGCNPSWDQHSGVEDSGRVERGFEATKHRDADWPDLTGQPWLVVDADGVVVGDRGTAVEHRVAGLGLRCQPLANGVRGLTGGDGEVEGATGLVDMRDMAQHESPLAQSLL